MSFHKTLERLRADELRAAGATVRVSYGSEIVLSIWEPRA